MQDDRTVAFNTRRRKILTSGRWYCTTVTAKTCYETENWADENVDFVKVYIYFVTLTAWTAMYWRGVFWYVPSRPAQYRWDEKVSAESAAWKSPTTAGLVHYCIHRNKSDKVYFIQDGFQGKKGPWEHRGPCNEAHSYDLWSAVCSNECCLPQIYQSCGSAKQAVCDRSSNYQIHCGRKRRLSYLTPYVNK